MIEIAPKQKLMWHVVVHIDNDNKPAGVQCTTDPYDHKHKAAIVMHKSGSRQVSTQVARFVRRTLALPNTTMHRANVPREAMIGYACTTSMQYPPSDRMPCFSLVKHIAETPVKILCESVVGGHNAARTRYVVYEVRAKGKPFSRFVSNKTHSVDRTWVEFPPDKIEEPSLHAMGRFETREAADAEASKLPVIANGQLWTRKPPLEYLLKHLEVNFDKKEVLFRSTGKTAIRKYNIEMVILGPHAYTLAQVTTAVQRGAWLDGRCTGAQTGWPGTAAPEEPLVEVPNNIF